MEGIQWNKFCRRPQCHIWGNSGYRRFSGRCPFGCSIVWPQLPKITIFGPKCILFHSFAWHRMILHGIELYFMVLHWYCMVLQDVALYCTVLHCIVLNLTVLHGIALYHCWLRRTGCISQDTYLLYFDSNCQHQQKKPQ